MVVSKLVSHIGGLVLGLLHALTGSKRAFNIGWLLWEIVQERS